MFFALSKSRQRAKIWDMGISKTSDCIGIKIKIPNISQDPAASSKSPYQHLKNMDSLCTIKFNLDSQYLNHCWTNDQWWYLNQNQDVTPQSETSRILESPKIWNIGASNTSDPIQIKSKMQNPSQKHTTS